MNFALSPLPENIDELRSFATMMQAELYAKTLHIEKLRAELAMLRRARFGRSSEKLDREIEQLELQLEDLEEGDGEFAAKLEKLSPPDPPPPPRPRKPALPKHGGSCRTPSRVRR